MRQKPDLSRFRPLLAGAFLTPLLSGCNMVVLDPAGDIARQQGNLVLISTGLMLLIVLPVIAMTGLFAWRYRAGNDARYEPHWAHSTQLELVIWAAPLLIIICLGGLTWVSTHLLDPYRAIGRTAPDQPVSPANKPLEIDVVALDWKWLFIYPEQGIATVNEMALPVGRPIDFRISASSVMNSFYIPALAGQIYAMPAMETRLHAVLNKPGQYKGISANYSGAGFPYMHFTVAGVDQAGFDGWVSKMKGAGDKLDRASYLKLEQPSQKVPPHSYATVEPRLFDLITNLCVEPGKMCMHQMAAIDANGGMGKAGTFNVRRLTYDKDGARGTSDWTRSYVAANCAPPRKDGKGGMALARADKPNRAPLAGSGLPKPVALNATAFNQPNAALLRPAS